METYPAFPGACQWVTLSTPGEYDRVELWDITENGRAFFGRNLYETVSNGDCIEICVRVRKPAGPAHGAAEPAPRAPPAHSWRAPGRGPDDAHACVNACVICNLAALKTLAVGLETVGEGGDGGDII